MLWRICGSNTLFSYIVIKHQHRLACIVYSFVFSFEVVKVIHEKLLDMSGQN